MHLKRRRSVKPFVSQAHRDPRYQAHLDPSQPRWLVRIFRFTCHWTLPETGNTVWRSSACDHS
jgi:hypothetical protein